MKTKTKFAIISICLLLLMIGFVGCSNNEDNEMFSFPNHNEENVESFFQIASNEMFNGMRVFFRDTTIKGEAVWVINNEKDFRSAYFGRGQLPQIDFSIYSLVIGKVYIDAGYYLKEQKILLDGKSQTLYLYFEHTKEGAITAFVEYLFWGLYPKLSTREITIKKFNHGIEKNV